MAAIAGWVAGRGAEAEALVAPLEALAHRGADDPGIATFEAESGQRVALGHAYYDEEAGIAVALDGPIANRAALEAALVRADTVSRRAPPPKARCAPTSTGTRTCCTTCAAPSPSRSGTRARSA